MNSRVPGRRPMPRTLRRRIISQIKRAMKNIDAVLGGESFRTDDERRAALALVRMAPRLFRPRTPEDPLLDQPPYHPRWSEAEASDLLERMEADGRTREECAFIWAEHFRTYGPEPGEYQTLEEAREYGRKVYDRIQAEPNFVPHAERQEASPS